MWNSHFWMTTSFNPEAKCGVRLQTVKLHRSISISRRHCLLLSLIVTDERITNKRRSTSKIEMVKECTHTHTHPRMSPYAWQQHWRNCILLQPNRNYYDFRKILETPSVLFQPNQQRELRMAFKLGIFRMRFNRNGFFYEQKRFQRKCVREQSGRVSGVPETPKLDSIFGRMIALCTRIPAT